MIMNIESLEFYKKKHKMKFYNKLNRLWGQSTSTFQV